MLLGVAQHVLLKEQTSFALKQSVGARQAQGHTKSCCVLKCMTEMIVHDLDISSYLDLQTAVVKYLLNGTLWH